MFYVKFVFGSCPGDIEEFTVYFSTIDEAQYVWSRNDNALSFGELKLEEYYVKQKENDSKES